MGAHDSIYEITVNAIIDYEVVKHEISIDPHVNEYPEVFICR